MIEGQKTPLFCHDRMAATLFQEIAQFMCMCYCVTLLISPIFISFHSKP
jgi:hypothetical protein